MDGVLVALVAIGISFIATLYPSWSAASVFRRKRCGTSRFKGGIQDLKRDVMLICIT